MSQALLKFCPACRDYTLRNACPRCGGPARPNRPAKYSPEDPYGDYRRRLKRMQAGKAPAPAGPGPAPAPSRGSAPPPP